MTLWCSLYNHISAENSELFLEIMAKDGYFLATPEEGKALLVSLDSKGKYTVPDLEGMEVIYQDQGFAITEQTPGEGTEFLGEGDLEILVRFTGHDQDHHGTFSLKLRDTTPPAVHLSLETDTDVQISPWGEPYVVGPISIRVNSSAFDNVDGSLDQEDLEMDDVACEADPSSACNVDEPVAEQFGSYSFTSVVADRAGNQGSGSLRFEIRERPYGELNSTFRQYGCQVNEEEGTISLSGKVVLSSPADAMTELSLDRIRVAFIDQNGTINEQSIVPVQEYSEVPLTESLVSSLGYSFDPTMLPVNEDVILPIQFATVQPLQKISECPRWVAIAARGMQHDTEVDFRSFIDVSSAQERDFWTSPEGIQVIDSCVGDGCHRLFVSEICEDCTCAWDKLVFSYATSEKTYAGAPEADIQVTRPPGAPQSSWRTRLDVAADPIITRATGDGFANSYLMEVARDQNVFDPRFDSRISYRSAAASGSGYATESVAFYLTDLYCCDSCSFTASGDAFAYAKSTAFGSGFADSQGEVSVNGSGCNSGSEEAQCHASAEAKVIYSQTVHTISNPTPEVVSTTKPCAPDRAVLPLSCQDIIDPEDGRYCSFGLGGSAQSRVAYAAHPIAPDRPQPFNAFLDRNDLIAALDSKVTVSSNAQVNATASATENCSGNSINHQFGRGTRWQRPPRPR